MPPDSGALRSQAVFAAYRCQFSWQTSGAMNRDQPVFAQLLRFLPCSHCADENNKNGINAHSGGIKFAPPLPLYSQSANPTHAKSKIIGQIRRPTPGCETSPLLIRTVDHRCSGRHALRQFVSGECRRKRIPLATLSEDEGLNRRELRARETHPIGCNHPALCAVRAHTAPQVVRERDARRLVGLDF